METHASQAAGPYETGPQEWEAATNVVAQIVRKLSGAGRFAVVADIREELEGLALLPESAEDAPAALDAIVSAALAAHSDLVRVMEDEDGPRFYSTQFMTRAYAGLLLRKAGDCLRLIAETVRENSVLYPRPLPVGAFEQPPFSLTREEVRACLRRMAGEEAFIDIAGTRTSAGNEYLFSTAHLESHYAASLAEWIDVGQYDNP